MTVKTASAMLGVDLLHPKRLSGGRERDELRSTGAVGESPPLPCRTRHREMADPNLGILPSAMSAHGECHWGTNTGTIAPPLIRGHSHACGAIGIA